MRRGQTCWSAAVYICMHPALSHYSRTRSIPKQTPTCQQSHIITTVQAIQILLQKGRAWWQFMGTKHRCVSWGWVHGHDKADPNGAFSAKWFTRPFWGDLKVKELQPKPFMCNLNLFDISMYHGIPKGPIWQVLLPIVFTSWTTFRLYFRRPKELHSTFQRENLGEWSGKTHHVSLFWHS